MPMYKRERVVTLYNAQKITKIFVFKSEEDYNAVVGHGWEENPANWNKTKTPVTHDVTETEVPKGEDSIRGGDDELRCDHVDCHFVGKNDMSLKTHKRIKHGRK